MWGKSYDELTFSKTDDVVCQFKSDASKDTPPADADPVADDYDKLKGSIKSPYTNNDTASGLIRE